MDEHEAIARLQRGDIGGLETLVRLHQVRAVRAAYLIVGDTALAEDGPRTPSCALTAASGSLIPAGRLGRGFTVWW